MVAGLPGRRPTEWYFNASEFTQVCVRRHRQHRERRGQHPLSVWGRDRVSPDVVIPSRSGRHFSVSVYWIDSQIR